MEDTKELQQVNEEELASLLAESAVKQQNENTSDGVQADYILLAKSGTKALKRSNTELFIDGLSIGDFFLQKEKKVLGHELRVVPLAFLTLYQEKQDESKDSDFFGYWSKEQAESFELVQGSYFNRQLPNGHILVPVNWVCVEVLENPEIEKAVIAYKSTGSRIWRKWKEDAKPRSSTSATLVYKISELEMSNKDHDWTDIGFEYAGNLLETDKALAVKCLKKSNAIRDSYMNHTLVPARSLPSATPAALPAADVSQTEETFDDNGF